jgi:alpha-L-rhamnosidase
MLDSSGEFTQANFQLVTKKKTTPLQKVDYICKDGINHYKTKFAIFGFQYVLVETEIEFTKDSFIAIAVYSDMKKTFEFDSSNVLLNKFVQNTYWSVRGNSADVLTDCPQRERHAWTGDAQIFSGTAAYMLQFAPFARKYIADMCDAQRDDGAFRQISPKGGVDPYMQAMDGAAGWADAGVIIPYSIWKHYGDTDIIKKNYDAMKRYAGFLIKRCGKRSLFSKSLKVRGEHKRFIPNCGGHYGEWAEPEDVHHTHWYDCVLANPEVATAYASNTFNLLREIASALGKEKDKEQFEKLANKTKAAYSALRNSVSCPLNTNRPAMLVRPLYFGLLEPVQKKEAQKLLVKSLEDYGWRIGTGFLSTPLILDVLTEINIEYAYKLLENEEMPGWLFMPKKGATTVWENWEGMESQTSIGSRNHYSKGACCEWLFRVMCGVNISDENRFVIAPKPGGHFTFAKLAYNSIYGNLSSGWERKNGKTIFSVIIPANTTAEVILPDGHSYKVNSGEHCWEFEM